MGTDVQVWAAPVVGLRIVQVVHRVSLIMCMVVKGGPSRWHHRVLQQKQLLFAVSRLCCGILGC